MKNKIFLLLLCIGTLFSSCLKDQIETEERPPEFVKTDPLFSCGSYEQIQLDEDRVIRWAVPYNDLFLVGAFEWFLVIDSDGSILLEREWTVNRVQQYQSSLLICVSQRGIFELTEDLILSQRSGIDCDDLVVTDTEEVYFVGGSISEDFRTIKQLDTDQDTVYVYSDVNPSSGSPGLGKLLEVGDGEFWAVDEGGRLIQYLNGAFSQAFSFENAPILEELFFDDQVYFSMYKNEVVVVVENGSSFYQILKYDGTDWIVLKQFLFGEFASEKDIYMLLASVTDIEIIGNYLYVSTTLASCRGIHRFFLDTDQPLTDDQYDVFHDPMLPGQCVDWIYEASDGGIFIVTAEGTISIVKC
jgi:hypothetical protein